MHIEHWRKSKTNKQPGFFLRLTKLEACKLIESLAAQLVSNNPNVGRKEFTTDEGEYLTVAVESEDRR